MNKKGAELSLNVIIIAIIVLIVLVVVVIIFGSRFNIFSKTSADCQTQGGVCETGESIAGLSIKQCPEGETKMNAKCDGALICCIKVLK